ncbi:hypothetical protein PV05_03530 [Exophiala xenobiotica]|uniref:Uncharacterized protein n=1 Tax=Exophiala xenobiotica TaxID=348802 RepID=A0A0D2FG41_9EURO|nr:uncharacterized protein PV05_03530 [Exophiala xenobiotica]KIW59049.1 hypothetical protein PV05_03530 [Exophiala xenobiotica]
MQVAAYCPMLFGDQDQEKRGVLVEAKNTMAMDSIPMSMVVDDAIGMELLMELAVDIPDIVEVGEADVDIVILMLLMPFIDIMLLSMIEVYRYALGRVTKQFEYGPAVWACSSE